MVMIEVPELNSRFYLDKTTKKEIDVSIQKIKNYNMDCVIVIDGAEGSGKSLFARQIGYYMSKELGTDFGVDNIHFELAEYIKSSDENKPGWVNILDESRAILNKKRSVSNPAVLFTNYLSECRKKRQVHILLLPSYHDLDNYIVKWRMNLLLNLHMKTTYDYDTGVATLHRGEYVIYSRQDVFWYVDHKELRYKYPKYSHEDIRNFKGVQVLSEEQLAKYEEKKDKATFRKYTEMPDLDKKIYWQRRAEKLKEQRDSAINMLSNHYTQEKIGQRIGLSQSYLAKVIEETT